MSASVRALVGGGPDLGREQAMVIALVDEVRTMLDDGEVERAEHFFRELAETLARWLRAEEAVMYARASECAPLDGTLSELRAQQARLLALAAAVARALADGRAVSARAQLDELARLLAAHINKEERAFGSRAAAGLEAGDRAALAGELKRR